MLVFRRGCLYAAFLFVSVLLGNVPCLGQEMIPPVPALDPRSEPLVTDRPDFTESALTVPRGLNQAEFGLTATRSVDDKETGFGEVLLRLGIEKRMELRISLPNYLTTRTLANGQNSGLSDASIGFKFSLARAGDRLGLRQYDVGLIVGTTLPVGSSVYRERKTQPGFKFLVASALTETIAVAANLNYDYVSDSGEQYGEAASSLSFGCGVTNRTGIYAEYFGFYPTGVGRQGTNFVNTGFTYLVSNDLQLDARVGKGLNGIQNDYFIGAGSSIRF